jgi:4-hydroxymandelate oxidase
MPILIAPTALQGLAHPEGEIATTKAAGAAKILTTLATLSTTSIEEAMAAATGPVWFQLYVFKDRAIGASLVQRAEAAGCKAVVLTVDVPKLGKRERDVRNRLTLPDHLSLKNLLQAGCKEIPKNADAGGSGLAAYVVSLFDPALTWKDIEWLARVTKLPILVKGILRPDDALRAVKHGASGIIVSNHGARQLDTTPATISILPEIIDAVADAVEVYVDGGIRRGTDGSKQWLMARAVFVGRPIPGTTTASHGVSYVLEMLRQELIWPWAVGLPKLTAITRSCPSLVDWDLPRMLFPLRKRQNCPFLRCF